MIPSGNTPCSNAPVSESFLAGMPPTVQSSGNELLTTALAPIATLLPMVMSP